MSQGTFKAAVAKARANQGQPVNAGIVHSIRQSDIPGHHEVEIHHGDMHHKSEFGPGGHKSPVRSVLHLPKGHGHEVGDKVTVKAHPHDMGGY